MQLVMRTNPAFPPPELVRREIIQMCRGLSVAILCPVFTLFLSKWGYSKGYCGFDEERGFTNALQQIVVIISFSDFFEYVYHWLGHYSKSFWEIHRYHHFFYNPTPFAVIADEWADQFVRKWPMVLIPLMMKTNMDLLFGVFVFLFYGYGVYLHWGYESKLLSAHNPIFNTSYHHYIHHAVSAKGRPIYTGFFFKIWDQLFNTNEEKPCSCVECRPKRTQADFDKLIKPDYSVLLSVSWWLNPTSEIKESKKK